MFTLGLIGSNLEILSFFSTLSAKQKKMVAGVLITGDTFDECSPKIKKPAFSNVDDFSTDTEALLFLSESEQNFELVTSGLKQGKDIILAKYAYLDLEKIARLEKLGKEAERNFLLLPTSDFLQGRLSVDASHTYYVHRERQVPNFEESTLLPIIYTDLLRLHDLAAHAIDRIKTVAAPKLMNEHAPIALSVTFTNGLHCSLVYSQASKRNLFTLYHDQQVVNAECAIEKTKGTSNTSNDGKLVNELLKNLPVISGLHDTSLIKHAVLCVKEMIK